MSETINRLFEGLKAAKDTALAVAPGLKDIVPDTKAELSRLGTQGSMELASVIFNGQGFVQYGPGVRAPEKEEQKEQEQEQQQGIER